jgi:hypothetical protein
MYLAVVLELGQLFVLGRTFDVTDIITQCAAAAVGLVIVRRAGWGVVGTVLDGAPSGTRPQIIYPLSHGESRSHRRGSRHAGRWADD